MDTRIVLVLDIIVAMPFVIFVSYLGSHTILINSVSS
jgi:hypothetical protein